jgi:DNA-binding transcriptional ArsR family regulator
VAGGTLLQRFSDPPYGYSSSVVKACVAGLLLAGKLRVRVANQPELTSVSDAGARDFFEKDRTFRQADIFPAGEQRIKPQDRAKIRELFATVFQIAIEPENEAIADAVGTAVTAALGDLRDVQRALSELPGQPEAPAAVEKLQRVFEDCVRDRQVEPRVLAVRKHLDALREGVGLLRTIKSELTRDAIDAVKRAQAVVDKHYAQLLEAGAVSEDVKAAQLAVAEQLASAYPWRDVAGIERHVDAIREAYRALRARSIAQRGKLLEEAFERAKGMPGFDKLDDHDRNLVLRVLGDVVPDTTDEEVLPPLSQLVDGLRGRLNEALEHARERLSELRAKKTGKVVVTVSIRARDVEIASAADVDDLLERIRERLMEQIKKGQTVRLNIE